jgi:hypothetical protein
MVLLVRELDRGVRQSRGLAELPLSLASGVGCIPRQCVRTGQLPHLTG